METQSDKPRTVLDDLRTAREEMGHTTKENKLPQGKKDSDEIEEKIEASAGGENPPVIEPDDVEKNEETEKPEPKKADQKIRLAGREFDSNEEAFKYAEELEQERLLAEARNEGIREALHATQKPETVPPPEDNFDTEFYTDPKKAFEAYKEKAKQELRQEFSAVQAEEKAWTEFSAEYPDLADSRTEVNRILQENWTVLGQIRDKEKAKRILAQKTRAYFDKIVEMRTPRKELPNKGGQAVSPGGSAPSSVTQSKKEVRPLTMAEQLKNMRAGK